MPRSTNKKLSRTEEKLDARNGEVAKDQGEVQRLSQDISSTRRPAAVQKFEKEKRELVQGSVAQFEEIREQKEQHQKEIEGRELQKSTLKETIHELSKHGEVHRQTTA